MDIVQRFGAEDTELTVAPEQSWGDADEVSLYLERCQVDTPARVVQATWNHVLQHRKAIGKVVDFGAGDGRFAAIDIFDEYVGFEIDASRIPRMSDKNAKVLNDCAFSSFITDADICVGNPPFVRNQDLPIGWRKRVSQILGERTGVELSGLANAWQYFFLLAIASTKENGLCALIVPYEWVSRPSSSALRAHILKNRWAVKVYRLLDETFDRVLTTASITLVDKAADNARWQYFEETGNGEYRELPSPSGAPGGVLPYVRRSEVGPSQPRAVRGLSPGTQRVLTLSEGARAHLGLKPLRDVVPCVTTLRHVPPEVRVLSQEAFDEHYRGAGAKCWLIRTDCRPSPRLSGYLSSVPKEDYQTSTCLEREQWWRFKMPPVPDTLLAQGFRGSFPKAIVNSIGARAVGGVCGIFGLDPTQAEWVMNGFGGLDLAGRIVTHSNGLQKIEINQINSLLAAAPTASTSG